MTLLNIVQRAARRSRIPVPSSVVGNSDLNVALMLELANAEGEELRSRYNWQAITKEATHTTLATDDQGALTDIAADIDLDRQLIDGTIYNRSDQVRVPGGVSPQRWQLLESSSISGPFGEYRIRGNNLFLKPTTAGETVAFEYASVNWCESATGTDQSEWLADDDVGLLSERLMRLGVIWRFKSDRGLDYGEDFRTYELAVQLATANDGGNEVILMDNEPDFSARKIRTPDGSWAL